MYFLAMKMKGNICLSFALLLGIVVCKFCLPIPCLDEGSVIVCKLRGLSFLANAFWTRSFFRLYDNSYGLDILWRRRVTVPVSRVYPCFEVPLSSRLYNSHWFLAFHNAVGNVIDKNISMMTKKLKLK